MPIRRPSALLLPVLPLLALGPARTARAENPMPAVRADRWTDAAAAAIGHPDPLALKLVTYYRLLAPNAARAGEIASFLDANPDWPNRAILEKRRDEALARESEQAIALALCGQVPPRLAEARLRCADAFTLAGDPDAARALLRAAWRDGITDPAGETAFLARYGAVVTPDDQWARFTVLAAGAPDVAARQAARLDPARRRAAEARLALRRQDPAAPALLAALPAEQRADPALTLEEARWLRRAGGDDAAAALWTERGEAAQRGAPDAERGAFWTERNLLARRLLAAGKNDRAYAVASLPGQTAVDAVADGAFLAGFIALRRLGDPERAVAQFETLAAVSRSANGQARAQYWLGRALDAAGRPAAATYARAAAFPLSFYGQRAAVASGTSPDALAASIRALADPGWTAEQATGLLSSEPGRAALLLTAWGEPRRAIAFLLRAEEGAEAPSGRAAAARLALGLGLPDAAVAIARRFGRDGAALPDAGWPVPLEPPGGLDPAVTLGVIRQESSFDPGALSPTGARGLMQLMPATAQEVARRLGEATSATALTADPAHNMRLGSAYLQAMLDRFGGSLPLAVAAYNAGPARVTEWLAANGDPRTGAIDWLDWIELIPFSETRGYVQRVLENAAIYRARRDEPPGRDPILLPPGRT